MPIFVGVAAAVAGGFAASAAGAAAVGIGMGTIGATLVGVAAGAAVGAIVGGIGTAVIGGDIGQGMLYGAIGGAVAGGFAGYAAASGGAVGSTTGSIGGGSGNVQSVGGTVTSGGAGTVTKEGVLQAAKETTKGGFLSGLSEGAQSSLIEGGINALGGAVSGMGEGELAEQQLALEQQKLADEKEMFYANLDAQKEMASMSSGSSGTDNTAAHLQYKATMAQLDEDRRQFDQMALERQDKIDRTKDALENARVSRRKGKSALKGPIKSIEQMVADTQGDWMPESPTVPIVTANGEEIYADEITDQRENRGELENTSIATIDYESLGRDPNEEIEEVV